MTTQQVADRFYELSLQNAWDIIVTELYSNDAKSIEPAGGIFTNAQGIDAIREKSKQFGEMIEEMHGGYCSQLLVAGNFFTCAMGMDVTMKGRTKNEA